MMDDNGPASPAPPERDPTGSVPTLPVPTVSVVIPAYNRAATIRGAIDSVLRQSFADFELIVVDDGSADATRDEVAKVDDPRLRLIALPQNVGAAAARNAGVHAARAPWVAFQDSDDEWLPLKLEKQIARLTAPPAAGAADFVAGYCGMLVLGRADDRGGGGRDAQNFHYIPEGGIRQVEGDLTRPLLSGNLVSTQTLIARRELLQALGPMDESLPALEDWEYALRLAERGPIACVDEPLVLQRFSPNSLSRNLPRNVTARAAILQKHQALFARDPKALAAQYYIVAGGYRKLGDLAAARTAIARARALQPGRLRYWAMSLLLVLAGLKPGRGGQSRPVAPRS